MNFFFENICLDELISSVCDLFCLLRKSVTVRCLVGVFKQRFSLFKEHNIFSQTNISAILKQRY